METATSAPVPASVEQRPWARGVGWMVLHSALMVAFLVLPSNLQFLWRDRVDGLLGWTQALPAFAFLAGLGFGIAAHNSYRLARASLAADPTLRGRWLTRNLWWVVLLALLLPMLGGLVAVVYVLGSGPF